MLRWLACAVVVVVTFVLCAWIKSLVSGTKSAAEIEEKVKERYYRQYLERGTIL